MPGWEDEEDGERAQVIEESAAGSGLVAGLGPQPFGQFGDRVAGECNEIEDDEHGGEVVTAVAEIVFEVVAFGLQRIEGLVLDPRLRGGGLFQRALPQAASSTTLLRSTGRSVTKLLR